MRTSLGVALALIASPALADVKAGVDAWSRGNYAAAIREWRQPAIDGDADAQFNLGQAYKLGRGVPVDLKVAEDWYRRAALQGHLPAEDNYGLVMFQNGNRQKALPYIQKSAARNEARAQYLLGTALFNGDMVKKDWPRAYALMTRASAAGLAPATASLAQMDRYIPLVDRQKGQAIARELESTAAGPMVADGRPKAAPRPARKPKLVRAKLDPPASTQSPGPAFKSGSWRIQLGAFRDASGARALWSGVAGKLAGLQPSYVQSGSITRLQAGGLRNKAAASRTCAAIRSAGQPCIVIAP